MTARLEIRYRKPVPLAIAVHFEARLKRAFKGLLDIQLSACMTNATIAADGKGRMMVIGGQRDETSSEGNASLV